MNEGRKKILIITTYFPPVQSVASLRIVSFVKYLPPEKYEIKIIAWSEDAAEAPSLPGVTYDVIYLPNPQIIRRAGFRRPTSRWFHKVKAFYNILLAWTGVNEMSGWGKLATRAIGKMQSDWRPDLILATYPYAEALRVGMKASKSLGIPLVADLRDAVLDNPSHHWINRVHLKLFEKQVVNTAARIITVSKPIADNLRHRYHKSETGFLGVRNGYDFAPGNPGTSNNVFTITFAGTFYGGIKPGKFFEAMKIILDSGSLDKIRIRFPGAVRNFVIPKELEEFCEFIPRMPYDEIIELIRTSDALLLILKKTACKGIYSAKLFDYLGVMRPIIAIVDKDDVAAQLIRECNAGFVAEQDDINEIAGCILKAVELWKTGDHLKMNTVLIEAHHRKNLAIRLESCLNELTVYHG